MKPWVVEGSMWQWIRLHLMLTRSKRQSASCRVSKPPRRPKELWRWCQCWLPTSLETSYAPWQTDTPRTFGIFLISHCRSITTRICYNVFKSISYISALQTNLSTKMCPTKWFVTDRLSSEIIQKRPILFQGCAIFNIQGIQGTGSTPIPQSGVRAEVTTELLCTLGTWGLGTRDQTGEPRKKQKKALLSIESWLF